MPTDAKASILVVDDEPGVRLVLGALLRQLGHRVAEAASAVDALGLIERESIDVVLTDYKMPGDDGLALLAELRRRSPSVPVILLTAHATVDVAVEALRRGAFDFLTKPIDREALAQALAKAIPVSDRWSVETTGVELVAASPAMRAVLRLCGRIARTQAPVLLTGPSGSGKEIMARHLHRLRSGDRPFVALNCGAIPEALLESELFGHVKGAFTGATCDKPGRVELAEGGTLFLDEIAELPLAQQVKLLRLLQERTFERVGGLGTRTANVRFMAATHRDVAALVREGRFREDLFFRLNVLPVRLAPLAQRPEDIAPLAMAFIERAAAASDRPAPSLTASAVARLRSMPWPGNARELGNLMERAVALCDGTEIDPSLLEECEQMGTAMPLLPSNAPPPDPATEKQRLIAALAKARGNRTLAAKLLGVSRRTLYYWLERHGVDMLAK